MTDELRERLAAYAHEAWSGWMRYLFEHGRFNEYDDTFTINADKVDRWYRQMETEYADLLESEKASDRKEADQILAIIGPFALLNEPKIRPDFTIEVDNDDS